MGTWIATQCWRGGLACLPKFRAHSWHSLPGRMVRGGGAVTPASRRGDGSSEVSGPIGRACQVRTLV